MEKALIEDNKEQFVGSDILAEALTALLLENHEEAITAAKKLFVKEYQTRKEIKELENKLLTAQTSLKKTLEKRAKVDAGDLSALFEGGGAPTAAKNEGE